MAGGDRANDVLVRERASVRDRLSALRDGCRVVVNKGDDRAILPVDADDLAAVLSEEAEVRIVAGSTDVGLWVTKFMDDISPAVFIAHLDDLRAVTVDDDAVTLGACVTYSEAAPVMAERYPHLSGFWNRIGGWQVRNMGTIGGNIANGSPIGDTPPVLIALGAEVTLRRGDARRTVALEDFFIDYGKQDREPADFVEAIRIPQPAPNVRHGAYKISKRRDEDISSVCVGIAIEIDDGTVCSARIAFGGMAATPKRAAAAETALVGKPWTEETVRAAMAALDQDYSPIDDWRASADYRARVARNLLLRFFLENSGTDDPVRLRA